MPWYRKNSATNTSVAGGVNNWRQIANLYRRNSSGNWEQIKRVYRKNSNSPTAYQGPGAWVLVHNSDTLNPYNTITPEFTTSTGRFHDTAVITLTRGTWANVGTAFAPITYDLDIQYSTDNVNWTNMVTGSGTTLTYTITSNDVSPPSYYFRGRVRVKNSSSVYSGYITVYATERSYRDIDVTYLFTTMTGHNYQASWTLSKANNSTNVNTQRIEIRTNDYFTYNGTSYSPLDLVYSVTVPAGTGTQQINFLNANIKQNQSYYTELVIIANDSDQTETYGIGDDFTYQGIPVIAPFDITSFTKGTVNASSQGATRTTTLNWGAATNASKYSVQYQGRTSDTGAWSDMEIFIPFINAPTTSATKSFTTGQTPDFVTFIRARIRASNDQGSTMIYNTSDYVEAVGTAPGQPSFGTITKTDVSASIPVTAGSQGSNYRYDQMEYQYRTSYGSYSGTWSTQSLSSGSGTISLPNLFSNQLYYIKIRNRNYDEIYSAENETFFTTNASLVAPTSTSISSMSRLTNSTVQAVISSSGAGGPYYQLYWNSGTFSSIPTTSYYDAASTSSTITDILSPTSGTSYYFLIRSSDQNFGNTTSSGSQNSGSYSNYGPTSSPATYTFASPSGGSVSVSGSSTVGSTLTASLGSPSASPSADSVSIVWRVNDGGPGGNTYTGGSILQSGGTTFVIPQYLYGSVSSVGYLIRAEVIWNNGIGSQSVNSTSTVVSAPSYTVTWNANGGSVSPSSASFTSGGFVTAPTPTRSGFSFNGWYDTVINDWNYFVSAGNQFYPPSRAITMYARWTAVPVNLTPPSIYYVAAGNAGGPVTAYFSGGSGPYYQIWWSSGGAGSSYDEYGTGNSITDNTGPGSAGTWYMYVRSVSSLTNVGTGPSATISDWSSAYAFTVTSSTPATAPGTPGTPTNGWTGGTAYPFSWSAPSSAGTVSGGGSASISYYNLYIYEATNSSGSGYYQINSYTVYGTSFNYTSPNASKYYACQVSATNTAGLTGGLSGFSAYK